MEYKIISENKLDGTTLHKIRTIFAESQCPNESLINSIKCCKGIVEPGIIAIGTRANYVETINV